VRRCYGDGGVAEFFLWDCGGGNVGSATLDWEPRVDVAEHASYAGCSSGRGPGGLGCGVDVAQRGRGRLDVVGICGWVFARLVEFFEGKVVSGGLMGR
jgi:hypothetical protein